MEVASLKPAFWFYVLVLMLFAAAYTFAFQIARQLALEDYALS